MKKTANYGISLVVLIITIVVMCILTTAIILSLSNNNPISTASKLEFMTNLNSFVNELNAYNSNEIMKKPRGYSHSKLQADVTSLKYGEVEDGSKTIFDIIPSLESTPKYQDMFKIVDGELVFTGTDAVQQEWVKEKGIEIVNIDEPQGVITLVADLTEWTNGNVIVTIAYPEQVVTKQYSTDGTIWNNYTVPVLVEDNTTVYAKGLDAELNILSEETLVVSNIDKTLPTVTLSNTGTTSSSITLAAVASDTGGSGLNIASYQYSKDNGLTWTSTTNETNYTFDLLTTGTYQCKVKVLDNAMNTVTSSAVAITTQSLAIITQAASPTEWTNGNVTVTNTYPVETVTKKYSTDGTIWNTYTAPIVVTTNNTTVYAKGLDAGGNQIAQATLTVANIDIITPMVEYGTNGGSTASTTVTLSDLGGSLINTSTLQYVWDTQNITEPSSGWTAFTNGETINKSETGTYYLWVKGIDNAGNIILTKSNSFTITILTYALANTPVVEPASVTNTLTVNSTVNGLQPSYNNPVIPAGFGAVNTTDSSWSNIATDWNTGLVIQDTSGNQFVWVPVDGTDVQYSKWCTTGTVYNNVGISDDTLPAGFNEYSATATYKGFYIARYESAFDYNGGSFRVASKKSTSVDSKSWSTKRNLAHTGYLWNFIIYTDAKTYSENMATSYGYDSSKVGTNMVTGSQWDTAMKWIQNSGKSVTDSTTWGNHLNSVAPANIAGYGSLQISGYSNYWKTKNIYDLAGNIREWTNEKFSTDFIIRGSSYNFNGSTGTYPASYRLNVVGTENYAYDGFRTALYIK